MSFAIECTRFCQNPLPHKPVLVIAFFCFVPVQLTILLGLNHSKHTILHPLNIYPFPSEFRYRTELLLVCTAVAYTVQVNLVRRLLNTKQQHWIQPV